MGYLFYLQFSKKVVTTCQPSYFDLREKNPDLSVEELNFL